MNSEMIKFFLSGGVPCGFADSEGEIKTSVDMMELLALNKNTPEMVILLEKIRGEKSPLFVIINLVSDYKKAPKVWQFHFIPLFGHDNEYIGTFFYAHEFLFLSPLEYVDGIPPYEVTTEKSNKLFTDKEWEVLFLALHRLNSKEIARRLNIGTRTVGHYLNIIYEKAGVHSSCQLRAFGKSEGFERYIPVEFIHKGRRFIEAGVLL